MCSRVLTFGLGDVCVVWVVQSRIFHCPLFVPMYSSVSYDGNALCAAAVEAGDGADAGMSPAVAGREDPQDPPAVAATGMCVVCYVC